MTTNEIVTVVALILGPVTAVLITLWYQWRSQRREAKQKLFITIMAHRKTWPPTYDWVSSLNLIDVVFSDNPTVIEYWQILYGVLETTPLNEELYKRAYLNLLSAMAKSLGYRKIQQTDIDKFYSPTVHGSILNLQTGIQMELLRVLQATKTLHAEIGDHKDAPPPTV